MNKVQRVEKLDVGKLQRTATGEALHLGPRVPWAPDCSIETYRIVTFCIFTFLIFFLRERGAIGV